MEQKKSSAIPYLIIVLIFVAGLIFCLLASVYCKHKAKELTDDHEVITCKVVSGIQKYGSDPEITVEYKDDSYTLNGAKNVLNYSYDQEIEAYLYDGEIYETKKSMYDSTKYGILADNFKLTTFFVGTGTFIFFIVFLAQLSQQKKLKAKYMYTDPLKNPETIQ